jgi:hypothetical protein
MGLYPLTGVVQGELPILRDIIKEIETMTDSELKSKVTTLGNKLDPGRAGTAAPPSWKPGPL